MAPDTPQRPSWTLMIYMAGDNGKVFDTENGKLRLMDPMTAAGKVDLVEMGAIGTTEHAAVTCLFDTDQGVSYLVEVQRGGRGLAGSHCHRLPGVNTGDPNTTPAVRCRECAPLSGRSLRASDLESRLRLAGYRRVSNRAEARVERPAVQENAGGLADGTTRPIAFDDSSKDFLDTADLRAAFTGAQAQTGVRLDLIGMDACLMAMVEGAQELAAFADYFVGSQEIEPMPGWPYAPVLAAMNREPGIAPRDLAVRIVSEFARSYRAATRAEESVTQSAISLQKIAQTVDLCKVLVEAVRANPDPLLKSLVKGVLAPGPDGVLTFEDRNYRDLGDFALKLARKTEYSAYLTVFAAAQTLYDHLQGRGPDAAVLRVAFRPQYQGATGLSVFLPAKLGDVLGVYQQLKFPQATGWDKLLTWLFDDFSTQWPT